MINIAFITPYQEMEQLAKETYKEYPYKNVMLNTINAVGANIVKKLRFNCEIIIARGVTAAAIKEFHKGIPVIELPVTGYDVIRAVDKCKKSLNPKKVAIIGSVNMIYGAQSLTDILDIDVECYSVGKEEDAQYCVEKAMKEGATVIIGGVMTTRIAESCGVDNVLIRSGKEAIRQALDEAVRTALISRQEREKAERFKIIMDYAHEGILAVDKEGSITVFNRSAQKIIKASEEDVLGKHVKKVLPNTGLMDILEKGREELGALQVLGDTQVAANRVPIKVQGSVVGAVATFQDITKIQELEGQIRKKIHYKGLVAKYFFKDIIGNSKSIGDTIETAHIYSKVDSNILIIGETGTGKELIAQSIHNASSRSQGPFVAVNCAALPPNLLESELFGYVEGAFTGAVKGGKAGLFELAHQGTIFLDEVAEISLELQGRLLRVLQEREIMRIGHDKVIPIDVRIISATNKNLKEMVRKGTFRQDLLYRLDVLNIQVPALKDRKDDIMMLINHFLRGYEKKFSKNIKCITDDARKMLIAYEWPGNIRELRNVCERLAVLAKEDVIGIDNIRRVIDVEDIQGYICEKASSTDSAGYQDLKSMADIEKEAIMDAIRKAGDNKAEAARILKISRTTLWRKLKDLEI